MNTTLDLARKLLPGVLLCSALQLAIALLLGWGQLPMWIGTLIGTAFSMASFILLGFAVDGALERDPAGARRYMIGQYALRLGLTAVVIIIGFTADFINPVGLILPLFYPKFVILAQQFLERRRKK